MSKKFYTIYKTVNIITDEYYIGKHVTKKPEDNYFGSGIKIKRSIKKYGRENFTKEILYIFDNEIDMNTKEAEIVTEDLVNDKKSMNIAFGGKGGFSYINQHPNINQWRQDALAKAHGSPNRFAVKLEKDLEFREQHIKRSRENLSKAHSKQKGRKRPNHAKKMKSVMKNVWKVPGYRENHRNKKSRTYLLTSPTGHNIITNRLGDIAKENDLPFETLFNSYKRHGKIVSKGKAKGWSCKILAEKEKRN